MKYISEYRDPKTVASLIEEIKKTVSRSWVIMEICGGQTHAIIRYGLEQLLPTAIDKTGSRPGMPGLRDLVRTVDKALAIASQPGVIFTSYGDMLRVPGSAQDLLLVRAKGGDERVVYSPKRTKRKGEYNDITIRIFRSN